MKGQAWNVWRGTPTTRRHFCSLNGAKKVKICPWVSEDELCATVLFFCLNHDQLVQFDQLYPWTLKNSTPEDQMKRKKWKILRGPSAKKKIKTPRPKSHPKKSSRPITNTSNPRFRDWVKFFRDPRFSRYHSISSMPLCFNCRFPLQTPCTQLAGFLLFLSVPGLWQTWPCNSLLTFLSKSISSLLFRRLPGLWKPNCPNFR